MVKFAVRSGPRSTGIGNELLYKYQYDTQGVVSLLPPSPSEYFLDQRELFGQDWYSKMRLSYGILRYSILHGGGCQSAIEWVCPQRRNALSEAWQILAGSFG